MKIPETTKKASKTVRLSPLALHYLAELKTHFATSEGKVLDQMLITYGPKILKQKEKK